MRKAITAVTLVALAGCGPGDKPLPPAAESGVLRVLTVNGPTTIYEDPDGRYAGLEHDLVTAYAERLGYRVEFIILEHSAQVLPALAAGRGHMAAAGLTAMPGYEKTIRFGPPYQTIAFEVAYNSDAQRPKRLQDLEGKRVAVVAGGGAEQALSQAVRRGMRVAWAGEMTDHGLTLIERLAEGEIDYVVARADVIAMGSKFYPNVSRAFALPANERLAWGFASGEPKLLASARDFFRGIEKDGTLARLIDRYYGHLKRLDQADVAGMLGRMRTRLPPLKRWFREGETLTGIDWRLLAALGYQESQWDPLATSPTGVRGLMMLTEVTADRMGVTDRLDPQQSIIAGAKYLQQLKDKLPERIQEPDRTWIALAAYNMGHGHLEDARVLAQRMGLNPDAWKDLKQSLPLLTRPDHYARLKHGYARGGEAVILAENVRAYYDILARFEERPGSREAVLRDGVTVSRDGEGFFGALGGLLQ